MGFLAQTAAYLKGSFAKLLSVSGLEFSNNTRIISGTTDPTSSAVDAQQSSLYLNAADGHMYIKRDNGLSTNWTAPITNIQQVLTVGKSGAQYTTITDALNAITDASVSKRYCIQIYPGVYNENITLKSYVDLRGIGTAGGLVTIASSTTIMTGTIQSDAISVVSGIVFSLTPATDNQYCSDVAGAIAYTDTWFYVTASSDIELRAVSQNSSAIMVLDRTNFNISNSHSGSTKNITVLSSAGTGACAYSSTSFIVNVAMASGTFIGFDVQSTGQIIAISNGIYFVNTDATFSGTAIGKKVTTTSAASRVINNSDFRFSTAGSLNGTCNCFYLDSSGNSAEIFYTGVTSHVNGFLNKNVTYTALGDTQKVWLNSSNMTLSKTGTGLAVITPLDDEKSGFVAWSSSVGDYWSYNTGTLSFTVLKRGTGIVRGAPIVWVANQSVTLTDLSVNYVYVNSAGILQSTTSPTDTLFVDNIALFEVWVNGSTYIVVKENHPYKFSSAVSRTWHRVIGTLLSDGSATLGVVGAPGAGAPTQTTSLTGSIVLDDHGITTDIPTTSPIPFRFFYVNGAGKMAEYSTGLGSGVIPIYWNNAGTPEALNASTQSIVFRLGAIKDTINSSSPQWVAILDTARQTSVANSNTRITSGLVTPFPPEMRALEVAQVGYAIMTRSGGGAGTFTVTVVTALQVFGAQFIGGGTSTAASLITTNITNFDRILSATDTTVQAALDTLDNGAAKKETGDIDATSFAAANNQVAPANVTGLTAAGGNGIVALVSVIRGTTSTNQAMFEIKISKVAGPSYVISSRSVGDDVGVFFDVTAAGQVTYTSTNIVGSTLTINFRARAL